MSCPDCRHIPTKTKLDPMGLLTASEKYAYNEAWGLLLTRWIIYAMQEKYGEIDLGGLALVATVLDTTGPPLRQGVVTYSQIAEDVEDVIWSRL